MRRPPWPKLEVPIWHFKFRAWWSAQTSVSLHRKWSRHVRQYPEQPALSFSQWSYRPAISVPGQRADGGRQRCGRRSCCPATPPPDSQSLRRRAKNFDTEARRSLGIHLTKATTVAGITPASAAPKSARQPPSSHSVVASPQQIQAHFQRSGVPVWSSRAEQVYQTVSKFSSEQLKRGMRLVYEADRGMRDAHPDDRIVMERFVMELTAQ